MNTTFKVQDKENSQQDNITSGIQNKSEFNRKKAKKRRKLHKKRNDQGISTLSIGEVGLALMMTDNCDISQNEEGSSASCSIGEVDLAFKFDQESIIDEPFKFIQESASVVTMAEETQTNPLEYMATVETQTCIDNNVGEYDNQSHIQVEEKSEDLNEIDNTPIEIIIAEESDLLQIDENQVPSVLSSVEVIESEHDTFIDNNAFVGSSLRLEDTNDHINVEEISKETSKETKSVAEKLAPWNNSFGLVPESVPPPIYISKSSTLNERSNSEKAISKDNKHVRFAFFDDAKESHTLQPINMRSVTPWEWGFLVGAIALAQYVRNIK